MGTQDGIPTTSGPSRGPAIGERSAVRFPLCQAVLVTSCNSMDKPYVHFSKRLSKVREGFGRAYILDFPIGGFSPPEGRLARGFKPPAFSRFLFQSAVKSAESF